MTVLMLAHNAIFRKRTAAFESNSTAVEFDSTAVDSYLTAANSFNFEWFRRYNKYGLISSGVIAILIITLGSYLTALYFIINTGFAIQEQEKTMVQINEEFLAMELTTQNNRTKLAEDQKPILESMEKISTVKYLLPQSFVSFENSSR